MRQLQTHARFGLMLSALALTSVPGAVLAQEECATDDDCEHGYSCEEVGGGCPAIDCAEGSDCDLPACEPTLGCVPVTDCEADDDCPASWKCQSEERAECNGGGAEPTCAPGEECVKPEPPPVDDCATVTYTWCVPPWALPCEEAADCGPGFECVEEIAMSCSGSSGSSGGGSDPGAPTPEGEPQPQDAGASDFAPPAEGDPLPPDSGCTSEPTGRNICQLIETACATDSDCGAGLTCQEHYDGDVACSSGGSERPAQGGAGGADGAGDAAGAGGAGAPAPPDSNCTAPEPTLACAPATYFNGGWGRDVSLDGGEATSGTDSPNQGSDGDNGEEPPTGAPIDPDSTTGGDDENATEGEGMMSESSGCSATGHAASGSGLLTALAVLGLALRRRKLRA